MARGFFGLSSQVLNCGPKAWLECSNYFLKVGDLGAQRSSWKASRYRDTPYDFNFFLFIFTSASLWPKFFSVYHHKCLIVGLKLGLNVQILFLRLVIWALKGAFGRPLGTETPLMTSNFFLFIFTSASLWPKFFRFVITSA
jgi:hypothetical protein